MFPPLPTDWSGLHPLVIHFPIALLLVAPIFVVAGMVFRSNRKAFFVSALVLMLIGTVAAFVAVSTGEAAGELAEQAGAAEAAIERHEELAETARNAFAGLTLVFAALTVVPMMVKRKLDGVLFYALFGVFLVAYGAGTGVLANVAHEGGLLVHQSGVHARLGPALTQATPPAGDRQGDRSHDDDD